VLELLLLSAGCQPMFAAAALLQLLVLWLLT
jgi:hypothetical protein